MQIPQAELYWGSHPKPVGLFDNIDIGPWLSSYNLGIQTHKIGIKNSQLLYVIFGFVVWALTIQYKILYIFSIPQYILLKPWNEYGFRTIWRDFQLLKALSDIYQTQASRPTNELWA